MPESLEQYTDAQVAEYGTYVATQTIFHNGSRAFNAGNAVPVSNVEKHGYVEQGLVEKVKPAKAAAPSTTEKKD